MWNLFPLSRSVKGLVSRGLVQQEKGTNKGDPYYKGLPAAHASRQQTNTVLCCADMLFFTVVQTS